MVITDGESDEELYGESRDKTDLEWDTEGWPAEGDDVGRERFRW
jgi:hypothetical protein